MRRESDAEGQMSDHELAIAARRAAGFTQARFAILQALRTCERPDKRIALLYAERAVELGVERPRECDDLGSVFRKVGELGRAEAILRRSLELDPSPYSNGRATVQLAAVIHEADKQRAGEARTLLKDLLDADPDNVYAYNALGAVCLTLGLKDEAQAAFEMAEALRPRLDHRQQPEE
jgi:tetratricopeptide (TPR) repeat protein